MITLRPVGGLCNRLLAIDSMIRICESIQKDLKVIWIKNEDLGCFLSDLYTPLAHPTVKIELVELESRPLIYSDRLMNELRQKVYNTFVKIYQKTRFDFVMHTSEMAQEKAMGYDFHVLSKYKNPYISSWGRMDKGKFNSNLFKPREDIQKKIPPFPTPTVGVHIRRSDHQLAISKTPLEKFIQAMNEELKLEPKTNFFIASDSADVKSELTDIYPDKIITSTNESAIRNSTDGMVSAMIDLYSLANTSKIIGTGISTFTLMASEINGIELIEVGSV